MLSEMGGDISYVDEPDKLVAAKRLIPVCLEGAGYISRLDARSIGMSALLLGAGREKASDIIDPAVGVLMKKRRGDFVGEDEPFAYMYVNDESNLDEAMKKLRNAVTLSSEKPEDCPLIYDIIE